MHFLPVLVLLATVPDGPPALKCAPTIQMPGYDENEPVVLIDGRVTRTSFGKFGGLDPEEIHSVEITCWSPDRDVFGRRSGLQVVRVHTKRLMAETRARLWVLIRAQVAYAKEAGSHARALEDLHAHGLPGDPALHFSASDDGWTASTPDGLVASRCTASFRAAGDGEPQSLEVECASSDGLEIQAVREHFEAAG